MHTIGLRSASGFRCKVTRFVHVLDEMTVDVLLEELDTGS
jgi:hypothetical protein